MSLPNLYQEMIIHLESMIASGVYASGDKLPAQRDLCAKFNLTKGTVGRGLAQMEKRGLVEIRHGAGVFVRRYESPDVPRVCEIGVLIEYFDPAHSYCGRILTGLQERAAEHNCGLQLRFTRYEDYTPETLHEYAEKFDAVILIGIYDTVARELPRTRPCVGVTMHHAFGFASTVDLDPVMASELAVNYFQERGRKRIICCMPPRQTGGIADVFDFRCRVFESNWPGKFQIADLDAPQISELCKLADDETGFLFVSGSRYERCAVAFRAATGRDLADSCCVLSIDGKSRIVPEYQQVDTIGTDYPSMGRLAFDECWRRIKNPGSAPRRIYQGGQLYLRRQDKQR